MGKIVATVIAAAALLAAIYLVLRRRPAPRGLSRFAVLISSFVALLGGGQQALAKPAGKVDRTAVGGGEASLVAHPLWKAVCDSWHGVTQIKQTDHDGLKREVATRRADNGARLDRLVKAGLVDRDAADVLNAIYADRIYHHLRQRTATCYDPTQLGAQVQTTRTQLEQRLALLRKHHGKLAAATAAKVAHTLQKEMEVLLQVETLWNKQQRGKPDLKEEQRILALFTGPSYAKAQIKDGIKIRPGVAGAMQLMRLIYR